MTHKPRKRGPRGYVQNTAPPTPRSVEVTMLDTLGGHIDDLKYTWAVEEKISVHSPIFRFGLSDRGSMWGDCRVEITPLVL